jgi:hypothetical protein
VQTAHPGTIQLEGGAAVDWKFTERVYEVRYLDTTPLAARRPTQRPGLCRLACYGS